MDFKAKKESLEKDISKEVRTLFVEEKKVNRFSLERQLMKITTSLYKEFHSHVDPIRIKIQAVESKVMTSRFRLHEFARGICSAKKNVERHNKEIKEMDDNLTQHTSTLRKIENELNDVEFRGDLRRLPMWVFIVLMTVAGFAEIMVYYNVFLSQEIGLKVDRTDSTELMIYLGSAFVMALGFTVMLIWLAHKMGMMLRQVGSVHPSEKFAYWIKFIVIAATVIGAIVSTVVIRGQMHTIMAKDAKIQKILDKEESSLIESMLVDDSEESDDENDDLLDEDDSDDGFSDDDGFGEDDETESSVSTEEKLRMEINQEKGETAYLFIVINIFIVVAGTFLAYATHTSSIQYEAIESMVLRIKKRRKKSLKELKKLEALLYKKEIDFLVPIIEEYVVNVNDYDELSQEMKSTMRNVENICLELALFMLGEMERNAMLDDIKIDDKEEFTKEYLQAVFDKDWNINSIHLSADEVIHINNIEQFIKSINCDEESKNVV